MVQKVKSAVIRSYKKARWFFLLTLVLHIIGFSCAALGLLSL